MCRIHAFTQKTKPVFLDECPHLHHLHYSIFALATHQRIIRRFEEQPRHALLSKAADKETRLKQMSNRQRTFWFMSGLTLLAFALRLHRIDVQSRWWDEGWLATAFSRLFR